LEAADAALYEAKHNGKGRVCRNGELDGRAAALARRAQALQRGLAAGELTHADRVAVLASEVGARLGLSREELDLLRVAGSLHDIGKLGLPHALFTKPGALDAGERRVVARHPELSAGAAEALGLDAIADWIRYHHERWDGAGYPSGLAGSRIPLPARILAVVDAYDAMTSDRPYRLAMATEEALAELDRTAGSQFDPAVVAALAAYLSEPARAERAAPALARVA
jgi:HD-GYP domain-containing protein (c-di-GMP phosphodiesterase class II)